MSIEMNSTIFRMLAKRATSGCPIWGALTLNEYCQPGDPIWTALWSKFSNRIAPKVPRALVEMIASGARASEIDIDWKEWCNSSNPSSNSRPVITVNEERSQITTNSGFRRLPSRERLQRVSGVDRINRRIASTTSRKSS